jgi:biopolymer transport protein ExbD
MRTSLAVTVVFLGAAVGAAAPIRPPRVPDDPPLAGQTLAVSLNLDGALVVPDRGPLNRAEDVKSFLKAQLARINKVAETNKEEFAPAMLLGADVRVPWTRVVEILDLAREVGFRDVSFKKP